MFKTLYRVIALLKDRKKIFILLTVANLLFALLILVEPIIFKEIIDTLISFEKTGEGSFYLLSTILLFWLLLGLIIIILRIFVSVYADRLIHEEFNNVVYRFYSHILELSMKFHTNSNSGELVKKITKGADSIFMSQVEFFRRIMPDIFTIILLVPLILYLNIQLGLFVLLLGTVSFVIAIYVVSKAFYKQDKMEKYYDSMSFLYADSFSNIGVIKSFTLIKTKILELSNILKKRLKHQYPILNWWGFLMSFSKIMNIFISIGVIAFGVYLFFDGKLSIGEIVMFLSFSTLLLSSIENIMWSIEGLFWRSASIKSYFKVIDTKKDIVDLKKYKKLKNIIGKVEFDNVGFAYEKSNNVLKNISFKVKSGEKVAFVGHTGSGKTTTSNLLLRFFEPQQGKILIDGIDIKEVSQNNLRENISMVFQENILFNATLFENIRLSNKKATKKDILKALKQAHALDFIKRMPKGLDTIVGERGVKLSGGEKQRIAIARAILKNAPILILDEATSALDAKTEKGLQDAFDTVMKDKTTFIIAHRLSTIKKADRIFVFEKGKIVETGSYKELYTKGGYFTELVEAQVKGFIE